MNKREWSLLILVCLIISVSKLVPLFQEKIEITKVDLNGQSADELSKTIQITKDDVFQGNLLLVNKDMPVRPDSVKTDVAKLFLHKEMINGYGLLDTNIRLSKQVTKIFSAMIAAAKQDGVTHFLISSGYRDFDKQNELYEQMGSDYALPAGYSEHNLGLSLDVGSTQQQMSQAREGKWIKKNAWRYGFVLRYPEDKTAITGIQYEPWHIRYVGLPHSAIMYRKNFSLEEYLDYVKNQTHLSTTYQNKEYHISYYPVSKHKSIQIPKSRSYEVSGNNSDGIIVTSY